MLGVSLPVDPAHPLFGADFDAVIFDVDGTLIDSTASFLRSWELLGDKCGFDGALEQENHGGPARELFSMLVPATVTDDAVCRISALELEDVSGIDAIPGAAEMLEGFPHSACAVINTTPRVIAMARMRSAGLRASEVMVALEDVVHKSSDPEPYLITTRRLGVAPERCVVFEDAVADTQSARVAGCRVGAVSGIDEDIDTHAEFVIDAFDSLRVVQRGRGYGLEVRNPDGRG